jgi:hypothetical protein
MLEHSRQEHHRMELIISHPSGVDELYCPTCGRRILLQWPPDYQKTVLEVGDEYAIHSGSKGGLEISAQQIIPQPELAKQDADRLDQWEQWLSEMGFDDRWSGDT